MYAGIPPALIEAAQTLVDKFELLIGFWAPTDGWAKAIGDLAKSGLSGMDAYDWLYNSTYMTDAQRQANPWSQFGMEKDTYTSLTEKLQNSWFNLSGDKLSADLLKRAIRENWTPSEMTNFLIYGDPAGGTGTGASTQQALDMPWLLEGQTYEKARQGYVAQVGLPPSDKQTLASWWRFGQGARQLTDRPMAVETQATPPGGTTPFASVSTSTSVTETR